jgi:hypothetical protein
MDLTFFTTPAGIAIIAPIASFVAGVVGASISSWTIYRTHKQRLAAEERLAERKFEFEKKLAERRIQLDLDLDNRKRRVELAETVLADFYEVRDIYSDARAPMVWAGEMVPEEGDSELVKESAYAPINRLSRHNDVLARFWSREYEFAALFGPSAREPYHAIRSVRADIQWAVEDLLQIKRDGHPREDHERRQKAYAVAFRPSITEPDSVKDKLDQAVKHIESISRSTIDAMHAGEAG